VLKNALTAFLAFIVLGLETLLLPENALMDIIAL
jgi:hypothetical protein